MRLEQSRGAAYVARRKQFDERILLPLTADMLTRIDSSLTKGEARLDLIRSAIERELKRRSRSLKQDNK